MSDVMAMLIACTRAQASGRAVAHIPLIPCVLCGDPSVALVWSGPVVCVTCRIRQDARA